MANTEAEQEEPTFTLNEYLEIEQEQEEEAQDVLGGDEGKECTYSKGYMTRQAVFVCKTCTPQGWWEEQVAAATAGHPLDACHLAGVCFACSLKCHDGHEMIEIWTKRRFRCDCGNSKFAPQAQPSTGPSPLPAGSGHSNHHTGGGTALASGTAGGAAHGCQLCPDKTLTNERNHYNQNFVGLYCSCHRPYPDPELESGEGEGGHPEDMGDMRQCVVCEDWYHEGHLGLASGTEEVPEDQLEEMVCPGCVAQGAPAAFLWAYRSISIPPARVGEGADRDGAAGDAGAEVDVVGGAAVSDGRDEGHAVATSPKLVAERCNGHAAGVGEAASAPGPEAEDRPAKRVKTESGGDSQVEGGAEPGTAGGGRQQVAKSEGRVVECIASGSSAPSGEGEDAGVAPGSMAAPAGPSTATVPMAANGTLGAAGAKEKSVTKEEQPSRCASTPGEVGLGGCQRSALSMQAEEEEERSAGKGQGAGPGRRRALFFRRGWREELCRCATCLALYRSADVEFLLSSDDTLANHAERARAARAGQPSMMERATTAFSQRLNRVQQVEMLHAANEMQTEFARFFAPHAAEGRVVTPEDIQSFFAQLTAKRRAQRLES
eukprot:jgi/Mesvir1/17686/Mv07866-RA.1